MKDNLHSKNKIIVLKKGSSVNPLVENSKLLICKKESSCDNFSRVSSHNKLPNLYSSSSSLFQSPYHSEDSYDEFFDSVDSKIYELKTEKRIVKEEDIHIKRELIQKKEIIQPNTKLSNYLVKNASPCSLMIRNNSTIFTTPKVVRKKERRIIQRCIEYDEIVLAKKSKLLFISNDINNEGESKNMSIVHKEVHMSNEYKGVDYYLNGNVGSKLMNIRREDEKDSPKRRTNGGVVCLRNYLPVKLIKSSRCILNGNNCKRNFQTFDFNKLRNKNIIKIQRWFRRHLPIKRFNDGKAVIIQSIWRSFIIRKKLERFFNFYDLIHAMTINFCLLGKKMFYWNLARIEITATERVLDHLIKIKSRQIKEEKRKFVYKWKKKIISEAIQRRINLRRFKTKLTKFINHKEIHTIQRLFSKWFNFSLRFIEQFGLEFKGTHISPKKVIKKTVHYSLNNLIVVGQDSYSLIDEKNYKCKKILINKENKRKRNYINLWKNHLTGMNKFINKTVLQQNNLKIYLNLSIFSHLSKRLDERIKEYYEDLTKRLKKQSNYTLKTIFYKRDNYYLLCQKRKIIKKWFVYSKLSYERFINNHLKSIILNKLLYFICKRNDIGNLSKYFVKIKSFLIREKSFINSINNVYKQTTMTSFLANIKEKLKKNLFVSKIKKMFLTKYAYFINNKALKSLYIWSRINENMNKKDTLLKDKLSKIMLNYKTSLFEIYTTLWKNRVISIIRNEKIRNYTINLDKLVKNNLFSKFLNIFKQVFTWHKRVEIKNTFNDMYIVLLKKELVKTMEMINCLYRTRKTLKKIKLTLVVNSRDKSKLSFQEKIVKSKYLIWRKSTEKNCILIKLVGLVNINYIKIMYSIFIDNIKRKGFKKAVDPLNYYKFAFNSIVRVLNKKFISNVFQNLYGKMLMKRSIIKMLAYIVKSAKYESFYQISYLYMSSKKHQVMKRVFVKEGFNEIYIKNTKERLNLHFGKWKNVMENELLRRLELQRKRKLAFYLISNLKNKYPKHLLFKAFLYWTKHVLFSSVQRKLMKRNALFDVMNRIIKYKFAKIIILNFFNNINNSKLSKMCELLTDLIKRKFIYLLKVGRLKKTLLERLFKKLVSKHIDYERNTLYNNYYKLSSLINNRIWKRENLINNIIKAIHYISIKSKKAIFSNLALINVLYKFKEIFNRLQNNIDNYYLQKSFSKLKYKTQLDYIQRLTSSLIFRSYYYKKLANIKKLHLNLWFHKSKKVLQSTSALTKILNKIRYDTIKSSFKRINLLRQNYIKDKYINVLFSRLLTKSNEKQRNLVLKKYISKLRMFNQKVSFFRKAVLKIGYIYVKSALRSNQSLKKKFNFILKIVTKKVNNHNIFTSNIVKTKFLRWINIANKCSVLRIKNCFVERASLFLLNKLIYSFNQSNLIFYFNKIKLYIRMSTLLERVVRIFTNSLYQDFIQIIKSQQTYKRLKSSQVSNLLAIKKNKDIDYLRRFLLIWLKKSITTKYTNKMKSILLRYSLVHFTEKTSKGNISKVFFKWINSIKRNIFNEIMLQIEKTESQYTINSRLRWRKNHLILLKELYKVKVRKELNQVFTKFSCNINFVFKLKVCSKLLSKKQDKDRQKKKIYFLKLKKYLYVYRQTRSINIIKRSYSIYSKLNKIKKELLSEEDIVNNFLNTEGNNLFPEQLFSTSNNITKSKSVVLFYLIFKQETRIFRKFKSSFKTLEKRALIESYYDCLPEDCKLMFNQMKNKENGNELEYITEKLRNIPLENKRLLFYSFSISVLVLKIQNSCKRYLFSKSGSDYSSNILVSSFLRGESKEEEECIDKILLIQRYWKSYSLHKFISSYSRKLKFLSKVLKSLDSYNKDILALRIIKWKKSSVISILTQARNTIRTIVGEKLKFVNLRRKLIASQLLQILFNSYIQLKILKAYFKSFNNAYICKKGIKHLKLFVKRFSLNNIVFFSHINKVIVFKKLKLKKQCFSLFDERRFRQNRLVLKTKEHLAVVSIQERFRKFQKIKQKGLAYDKTRCLIGVIEEKLAEFQPNVYLKVWFRRSMILKKEGASNLIYKYLQGQYLLLSMKSLFLRLIRKILLERFSSIVKQVEFIKKSTRLIKRINRVIYIRRSYHILLRFNYIKKVFQKHSSNEKENRIKLLRNKFDFWRFYIDYCKQALNSSVQYLCESISYYRLIKDKENFWKKFKNYIDFKLVFMNLSFILIEAENNQLTERICQKLFKLYLFKVMLKNLKRKFGRIIKMINEYNDEEQIYTEKYTGKRTIKCMKFMPKMKKFSFKNL